MVSILDKAGMAVNLLGEIDEKDLPPFIRPMRNLVLKITSLAGSAQGDVMAFFNVSGHALKSPNDACVSYMFYNCTCNIYPTGKE